MCWTYRSDRRPLIVPQTRDAWREDRPGSIYDVPRHEHLRSPDRDPNREMSFNHPRCTPHCFGVCTTDLCLYSTFSIHGCAANHLPSRCTSPHPDAEAESNVQTPRTGFAGLVTRQLPPASGHPEQTQSADSACCFTQRQISAADMTRCVESG